jgi:hypothetical protein
MPVSQKYPESTGDKHLVLKEQDVEKKFVEKLLGLKYEYRPDITDHASLERIFAPTSAP